MLGQSVLRRAAPPGDALTGPTFSDLSVGLYAACGIRETDSPLGCWCCPDDSAYGLCDDMPAGTYDEVVVGSAHACARDLDGSLTCWGHPRGWLSYGEVPTTPVADFDVESHSACAAMPDGRLECWGNGLNWGEPEPPVAFAQIGVGRNSACGLEADGTAHCWGVDGSNVPFPAPPPGSFTTLEAYNQMACVLDAGGTPQCWWTSDDFAFAPPAGELFRQISLSEFDGCGVTLDGRAFCWGEESGYGETRVPELPREWDAR